MKPGDLSVVASALNHAMKTLKMRWDETQESWHDPISRKFDEDVMVPLEPQVATTLKAVQRLNQVMSRAYEDCI